MYTRCTKPLPSRMGSASSRCIWLPHGEPADYFGESTGHRKSPRISARSFRWINAYHILLIDRSPVFSVVSRVGIEPTTRRLRDEDKTTSIAADPGKLGSVFMLC